jgi:hypothetical protein
MIKRGRKINTRYRIAMTVFVQNAGHKKIESACVRVGPACPVKYIEDMERSGFNRGPVKFFWRKTSLANLTGVANFRLQ